MMSYRGACCVLVVNVEGRSGLLLFARRVRGLKYKETCKETKDTLVV